MPGIQESPSLTSSSLSLADDAVDDFVVSDDLLPR
jgi:hypothetical protein